MYYATSLAHDGTQADATLNSSVQAIFTIPVESEAEPTGDDLDGVTERTQAIERYKLNHDLFGQLFNPLPICASLSHTRRSL